jgi:hypothetical protein
MRSELELIEAHETSLQNLLASWLAYLKEDPTNSTYHGAGSCYRALALFPIIPYP